MSNIVAYQSKRGRRWEVRYRKPDGSTTRKRGFVRKVDAETWSATHVTVAKATGSYVAPSDGNATIGDLYAEYWAEHEPLWKPSMARTVASRWRTHVQPAFADIKVKDVTRASLQSWASALAAHRSASVVRACADILRAILDDAVADHRITSNPMGSVVLPKKPRRKKERVYLTTTQLLRFADECLNGRNMCEQRRAIVLVLGFCGLRWGEMCALTVKDVDLKRRRLMVRANLVKAGSEWVAGSPKNGSTRSVPMPQIVVDALATVIEGREGGERVFSDPSGRPPRLQSVADRPANRAWYVSALRRAGLPLVSPHGLRHTAASIAVHAGANVKALQVMLGHATASMTLDVYADLFDSDLDAVASAVDRVVAKEGRRRLKKVCPKRVQN